MRVLWALLLLASLPGVVAHGEHACQPSGTYYDHIKDIDVDLAAGASWNGTLAFDGCPFGEWWWTMSATIDGEVDVRLTSEGTPVAQWRLGDGDHTRSTRIPAGLLELHIDAVQESNLTFFYDQTCDCIGKQVPMQQGAVFFNIEATQGDHVWFDFVVQPTAFPLPPTGTPAVEQINITVQRWDQGGDVIDTQEHTFVVDPADSCFAPTIWIGCFEVAFTAAESGMQVLYIHAQMDQPHWDLSLTPQRVEVTEPKQSPLPLGILLLGLLVAARRRA